MKGTDEHDRNGRDAEDPEVKKGRANSGTSEVPIASPVPPEPDWQEKIQRAREAREAGIKRRKGKPVAAVSQYSPA
jgi:hypothetical protein